MQVDLSFTEPRFLDRNLAAGFDLFHKDIDQTSQSGFKSRRTGGSVRLGFPLSENMWLQTNYTLSRDQIFDVQHTALRSLIRRPRAAPTRRRSARASPMILRNDPKNPTKRPVTSRPAPTSPASAATCSTSATAAEARGYYPITEKITFVGRAIGGHIEGWGGEDVRLIDLFFKGGETVRGFDRAGFGPRDLQHERCPRRRDLLGGDGRGPLPDPVRARRPRYQRRRLRRCRLAVRRGRRRQEHAGGLAGMSTIRPAVCLADDSTIRSSVGASIMWDSPVGPMRMDFAKVLTKETYDDEQFFRFGASTKF